MRIILIIAAIGLTVCGQAIAGEPIRCVDLPFETADPSIRNIPGPGVAAVKPGDELILVNYDHGGVTVSLGDARGFSKPIKVKDCAGVAFLHPIKITGKIDVGDWTIDGNGGYATFYPLGSTWVMM